MLTVDVCVDTVDKSAALARPGQKLVTSRSVGCVGQACSRIDDDHLVGCPACTYCNFAFEVLMLSLINTSFLCYIIATSYE